MLSSQQDPKKLAESLELDYFRRPRPLARWRRRLARGGLAVGLLLGAVLLLPPWTGPRRVLPVYQAGPVSTAHAMFNDDCARCHTESFQTAARLIYGDAHRSVKDDACLACHDGAPHYRKQTDKPACATCHREHRGKRELARVEDAHCTRCHAEHITQDGPNLHVHPRRVTAFATDHPPFGDRPNGVRDFGTIRFNHEVHLRPEGVLVPETGPQPPKRGREPRRVELDCTSCHREEDSGRYMRPITYEHDCADCHPLSVQVTGAPVGEPTRKAVEEFANTPAPHREPEVVRAVLRQRYTAFALAHRTEGDRLGPEVPEPPLPGPRRPEPVTEKEWEWVGRQLHQAETLLFASRGGCAYCHTVEEPARGTRLPRYLKSALTDRWFSRSRFDHRRHRMLTCTACHGGAPSSTRTSDVLMPTIEDCRRCHTPQGGARHDCAECHLYHSRLMEHGRNERLKLEEVVRP
jgi:hypothetical protein